MSNVNLQLFTCSFLCAATHLLQRPTTSGFSQSASDFSVDAVPCGFGMWEGTSVRKKTKKRSGTRNTRTTHHDLTL